MTHPELRRLREHPVALTAIAGLVFVALQTWWIIHARHRGGFDVDEAGGIAAALRFGRALEDGPVTLFRSVFGTRNGPVVPLLSLPGYLLLPHGTWGVMTVQPALVAVGACGVAGSVRALGGRWAALAAGLVALTLPISIVSSRSYQYSSGVAAFLALACWALLSSERGHRPWPMVGFGAAVALMTMSRTMSIGFVPVLGLAALVVIGRDRRGIRNLGLAAGSAVVVAGPWWAVQWGAIMDYLIENAYGPRAHYWGSVTISARIDDHVRYLLDDFRVAVLVLVLALVTALLAGAAALLRRRGPEAGHEAGRSGSETTRGLLAVYLVALLGTGVLLSTSNRGYWFAHPVDLALVIAAFGTMAVVRAPSGTFLRGLRTISLATVTLAAVVLPTLDARRLVGAGGPLETSSELRFLGDLDRLHAGDLEAEPRLASPDADVRSRAADDWWDATTAVTDEVARLERANDGVWQNLTGEIHLFNSNTLALNQLLLGRGINALVVVNTLEPTDAELRRFLTPTEAGMTRVLLIVEGRSLAFPDGRGRRRFLRLALQEGWAVRRSVPLPDGGDVLVLSHPASDRSA